MEYQAWILRQGDGSNTPGKLEAGTVQLKSLQEEEILVAPLYGCVEANVIHAIERQPIDVCRQRKEPFVIPGNACVGKVMETGPGVTMVRKGDVCVGFGISVGDAYGYPEKVLGYDAPGVSGTMVKRLVMREDQMIPLAENSRHTLMQWAAFCARYASAWSNWKVAYGTWKIQMDEARNEDHFVCAWGGGVSLGELQLAKHAGFQCIMISSKENRLDLIRRSGIIPLDRKLFPDLHFDPRLYAADADYRKRYQQSETAFLRILGEITGGKFVSIFIDNIGMPVYRATLKALSRQGVISTCGWKMGMELTHNRAIECISRHTHVNTHYTSRRELLDAIAWAETHNWIPDLSADPVYKWEEVPQVCDAFAREELDSYFPVFEINAPDSV